MPATLGVIVPCRNEAAVIARKLRNLARCEWPASEWPHRIVVVDDGSRDGSSELARAESARFDAARVQLKVVANTVRPGKIGAITQGLEELGPDVDLVVLTDADVVLSHRALLELAGAFELQPKLGMATGAQTFVASLADDGALLASDGRPLARANTPYDVATSCVRAFESRIGLVFSVHGQLLAWRRDLALTPTPGIAADDLDLMLQVRARGLRIEWVRRARFFEVRAPRGRERELQAVRRARAYLQFLQHPRLPELAKGGSSIGQMQMALYLSPDFASGLAQCGLMVAFVAAVGAVRVAWGDAAALCAVGVFIVVALLSGVAILNVRRRIDVARTMEASFRMSDRWETARR